MAWSESQYANEWPGLSYDCKGWTAAESVELQNASCVKSRAVLLSQRKIGRNGWVGGGEGEGERERGSGRYKMMDKSRWGRQNLLFQFFL